MIRRAQQRRGIIDSQIRQWQRYREMAEKLRKWLVEVSYLPMSGLGSVPIPLQQARTLFDEVQVRCKTRCFLNLFSISAAHFTLASVLQKDSGVALQWGQTLFSNVNRNIQNDCIAKPIFNDESMVRAPSSSLNPSMGGKTVAKKGKLCIDYTCFTRACMMSILYTCMDNVI